jgi:hypothetical protein
MGMFHVKHAHLQNNLKKRGKMPFIETLCTLFAITTVFIYILTKEKRKKTMYLTRLKYNWKTDQYTLADIQNENRITMPENTEIMHTEGICYADVNGRYYKENIGKVYIIDGHFYAETEQVENAFS